MKLNITPGPWATNADISFIYGDINRVNGTMEDLICDPPNCEESYNNWKDNAAAIVTAVNNTYHKGINPEAVPEMYNMLRLLYGSEELSVEESESILDILKKATL